MGLVCKPEIAGSNQGASIRFCLSRFHRPPNDGINWAVRVITSSRFTFDQKRFQFLTTQSYKYITKIDEFISYTLCVRHADTYPITFSVTRLSSIL